MERRMESIVNKYRVISGFDRAIRVLPNTRCR
jgi:hypothetical protein